MSKYIIAILIAFVFLFSPRAPGVNNGYFVSFALFAHCCWQRQKIREYLIGLKWPKSVSAKYLAVAVTWSLFIEKFLGKQGEQRYPLIIFLISLSFTLPYFIIWHKIIKKYSGLSFPNIFLLSGFSGALAQTVLTPKITAVFSLAPIGPALFMALFNFLSILVLFGMLTTVPLFLLIKDSREPAKMLSAKEIIWSSSSVFLAVPFFLLTVILAKLIFPAP